VVTIGLVRRSYTLIFTSELDASMASVWEVVGTMKGVNAELAPWLSMTVPPEASKMRIEDAPVGRPMFTSWVLLRGILPIDRHSFMLAQVEPGHGFAEDSTSWSQLQWEHRRTVEPRGERGCVLTDRLTFTPRLHLSGPVLVRVIGTIFRHRHRLLRGRFGGRALSSER
jgi:ligand-binding SRPBCC domain-containing protein